MHEIVTLQFGNQSNYLGTHFWNAQVYYAKATKVEHALMLHARNRILLTAAMKNRL